jgi:hypothetical protein
MLRSSLALSFLAQKRMDITYLHWLQSLLTLRILLRRTKALPWNLVPFLDEAAERLLLYKVGSGYIFIHRLLLNYLAKPHASPPSEA